jgi:hypothetical protein
VVECPPRVVTTLLCCMVNPILAIIFFSDEVLSELRIQKSLRECRRLVELDLYYTTIFRSKISPILRE